MLKCQSAGMQGLSTHIRRRGTTINRVSDQRVSEVRHVDPDLVRAAGVQNTANPASDLTG
jgi:hypothetical protein